MPAVESHVDSAGKNNANHTRTYQACIPCRRRKVRCDLGPVDNPHEPPCVRCRRECKECFFSAERRKKRAADSGADDELDSADFEVRGGRKRLRGEGEEDVYSDANIDNNNKTPTAGYSAYPVTTGAPVAQRNIFRQTPLRRSESAANLRDEHEDDQVNSETAAILQTAEIHGGHDALNVLFEAATHLRTNSASSTRPSDMMQGMHSHDLPSATSPPMDRKSGNPYRMHSEPQRIDPAIQNSDRGSSSADMMAALNAWNRFKFVRSGWFSAQEGIQYVEYFYNHLSPLTPIVMPDYGTPGKHEALLTEEPMLAVTILCITSRSMPLAGPGAQSRPAAIHQILWNYLEGMINRLVWGQEQFKGQSNSGSLPNSDVNPYTRKGLRTLGTIESLMLLTEWHPRSMHFPGVENDSELMAPKQNANDVHTENADGKFTGGQDTWLEPCWRSDRICWMLLSMAMAMAMEIGVFDEDPSRHKFKDPTILEEVQEQYEQRRVHIKNLLLIYLTQTSGRTGVTSMLPETYSEPALSAHFLPTGISQTTIKDKVIHLWLRIASIMKTSNKDLFPNRDVTRELIRTGRYKKLLQELYPHLKQWRQTYESYTDLPPLMRHVLTIEFEYARVYTNSLGLQAMVERCTQNIPKHNAVDAIAGSTSKIPTAIPAAAIERWYGEDRFYIKEVVDGCHGLLRAVVEGLFPNNNLRHAPVRTYFRIISVAIILLKTFALGSTEDNLNTSIQLMEQTVVALRTSIVDDVHVASRFADLLDTLIRRIRSSFVRMSKGTTGVHSRAASDSPAPQAYTQIPSVQQSNMRNTPLPWSHSQNRNGVNQYPGPSGPPHHHSNMQYDYHHGNNPYGVMGPPTNPNSPGVNHNMMNDSINFDGLDSTTIDNFYNEEEPTEWFGLNMTSLLQDGELDASGFGPIVDGREMVDFFLNPSGPLLPG